MVSDTANTTRMTGAEAIVASLEALGVTDVFGMPGGAILPTYDPLLASTSIRHILVRHEQGAGHAAEGYALATGKVGCAIVTSGPGATNVLTALGDACMDSVPIVVISGQVGASLIGTDAFQEADVVGASMPITKHSFPRHGSCGDPGAPGRGLPPCRHRPPRPCPRGYHQVRAGCGDGLLLASRHRPARLPRRGQAEHEAGARGRTRDRRCPGPRALRGRRHRALRLHRRPRRPCRGHERPRRHHADRPRSVPRL